MSTPTTNPLRIVVTEDNDDTRQGISVLLTKLGYLIVAQAANRTQLMTFLETTDVNQIDVCLLDVGMPPGRFGGIELGREVYRLSGISSVLYTGYGEPELIETWMQEEFVLAYVLKTAPHAQLHAALASARRNKTLIDRYRMIFRACTYVAQDRNTTLDEAYTRIRRYAQNKQIRVEEAANQLFTHYESLRKAME